MTVENQKNLPGRPKVVNYDVVYECCNEDHEFCFGGWWDCFQCGEPMVTVDSLSVLKKILSKGDVYLYFDNHPGIGLDYSWVDLTAEEVNFLNRLLSDD